MKDQPTPRDIEMREKFVQRFGINDARQIEIAAMDHCPSAAVDRDNRPFAWSLLTCIDYECIGRYSMDHQIHADSEKLREWIRDNADLASFTGSANVISMITGAYLPYMREPKSDD